MITTEYGHRAFEEPKIQRSIRRKQIGTVRKVYLI